MGEVQSVFADIEAKIEAFLEELKDKSEAELKTLYDDALVEEAKLKVEVVLLRERAANLASDVEIDAELAVIDAKKKLATAIAWLKALEQKLFGTVKDFNTGAKHGETR